MIVLISPSLSHAVPSGPSLEESYTMTLDKSDYKPGDTVIVTVKNNFYDGIDAFVTIRKIAPSDEAGSDPHAYPNSKIVFSENKTLANSYAEFRYTIPVTKNQSLFAQQNRYVVLLNDPIIAFQNPDLSVQKPVESVFFNVTEGLIPFQLIFGVWGGIAGIVSVVWLRRRKRNQTVPRRT